MFLSARYVIEGSTVSCAFQAAALPWPAIPPPSFHGMVSCFRLGLLADLLSLSKTLLKTVRLAAELQFCEVYNICVGFPTLSALQLDLQDIVSN
jgi:hypothetical protein